MKLTGIALHNFRSIGAEPVLIQPIEKCNVLVGRNNAGKSNILRAIQRACEGARRMDRKYDYREGDWKFNRTEAHKRVADAYFRFTLYFEDDQDTLPPDLTSVLGKKVDFTFVWVTTAQAPAINDSSLMRINKLPQANILLKFLSNLEWQENVPTEIIKEEFRKRSFQVFQQWFLEAVPPVLIVPEFRQLRMLDGDQYELDGANLIKRLSKYQHPPDGDDVNKQKFRKIQSFFRTLLHLPAAELEVTESRDDVLIENEGQRLGLRFFGAGVHQLLIMVAAVLSEERVICCIEEPELHLHPTLQREFLSFLVSETDNTYMLSTHSAALINAYKRDERSMRGVQLFHVQQHSGITTGRLVFEDADSLSALADLGVTASDVLQANCVMWVEGPSDRIYINRWLELVAPNLIEGLHYSIMYYGGDLRRHLAVGSGEATSEDLVNLLKINQHAIVVMDSDKDSAFAALDEHKQRVCNECQTSNGICWITDGREIENYLPARVVEAGYRAKRDNNIQFAGDPYEKFDINLSQAVEQAGHRGWSYSSAKVVNARLFAAEFSVSDFTPELRVQIDVVVAKILEWNP